MADPVVTPRPGELDRAAFLAAFGDLYEHSPWVAEAAWEAGIDARHDDAETLHRAFRQAVLSAPREQQLGLLRAHPQLAARRAPDTAASRSEQSGAGLDRCSEEEWAEFQALNAEYLARHGFPFIVAVRGLDRQAILRQFRQRLARPTETEFPAALEEVCRIGWFRLQDRCGD